MEGLTMPENKTQLKRSYCLCKIISIRLRGARTCLLDPQSGRTDRPEYREERGTSKSKTDRKPVP